MPNNQNTNEQLKYLLYIEHGNQYTDLLKHYIKNVLESNKLKLKLKKAFFIIIILIMIVLSGIFCYSVYRAFNIIENLEGSKENSVQYIIGAVSSLIPSLATMLVSLIQLPKIIAKYLFNKKEDKHMANIIANIQNYDVQIYSIEQEAKAIAKKRQGTKDNEIPDRDLSVDFKHPGDDSNQNIDSDSSQDNNVG